MSFSESSFIIKNDGTLWGCGYNGWAGALGLGNSGSKTIFTQITTNTNDIKSIYGGYDYTIILKNDSTLYGCGRNDYGQLGLGDVNERTKFTKITDDVKSAYCGYNHTIILKNDNTLWGCGNNNSGELGLGDKTPITILTKIANNVKSACCGCNHTLILKNDGTLWGCGYNSHSELGLGDTTNRNIFTQITANADNVKSVYCELNHTLILKKDGTLWVCGSNYYGQLGLGDNTNRNIFTQITVNVDNIKSLMNDYPVLPSVIKIYDSNIGLTETLDINNFRNIHVDKFEKIKALYIKPDNTILNCLISFDQKQTWKTFNGNSWTTVSDTSGTNMIVNCMGIETLNNLNKSKLIQGGFTGDLDFKIVMKTNDENKTPSVTKIYIEYK